MAVKRDILPALTLKNTNIEFHPNNTEGLAVAPVTTSDLFSSKLRMLGLSAASDLPKSFDWRKQPGVELAPVVNQGHCGNCWAISSTGSFGDRWMIAKGKTGLVLDPLPTTVSVAGNKCGGGLPENCQAYFEKFGASVAGNNGCPSWKDYCKDTKCCYLCGQVTDLGTVDEKTAPPSDIADGCTGGFRAVPGSSHAGTVIAPDGHVDRRATIESIKTDIRLHGPVVGKFQVFGDFMVADAGLVVAGGKTFKWEQTNGIYINGMYDRDISATFKSIATVLKRTPSMQSSVSPEKLDALSQGLMPMVSSSGQVVKAPPSQSSMGFHAVEIVGWDVDPKWGEYWIVKNSWGPEWNDKGYFKYAMNTDGKRNAACGLDIPLTLPGGSLFGGTVSFIPHTNIPHPDWKGKTSPVLVDGDQSSTSTHVWFSIALGVLVLLVFIMLLPSPKPRYYTGDAY